MGSLWRRVRILAATLLAVLLAVAIPAGASAAQTVVSFESLPAGTVVTNQVLPQGLEFGTAEQFGQISPPATAGRRRSRKKPRWRRQSTSNCRSARVPSR